MPNVLGAASVASSLLFPLSPKHNFTLLLRSTLPSQALAYLTWCPPVLLFPPLQALDHHPDSDELLLAYLTASAQRDDAPMLQAKWAKVLERLSGSCLLWREYIRLRKGQYSSFSVSDVRGVYAQALAALAQERNRVRREGAGEDKVRGGVNRSRRPLFSIAGALLLRVLSSQFWSHFPFFLWFENELTDRKVGSGGAWRVLSVA